MAKHLYEFQMVSGNPGHPVCNLLDLLESCNAQYVIWYYPVTKETSYSIWEYPEKNLKLFLYRIYSTTFFRYFVYHAIKLIQLWILLFSWAMCPMCLFFNYLQWRSDVCVTDFKWCRSQGSVNNNVTLIRKRLEGMFIIVHFFTVIICDVDLSYKIRL